MIRTRVPNLMANKVFSNLPFEDWLYNQAMFIRGEQYYSLDLVQAATVMHIRSRGVTVSDMVSQYGTRAETAGRFMVYDANLDGEVHPINIVGPAVTTNKNACLQSNAAVEVTAANQNAEHKQLAMKWQRVFDFFERTTWKESKRGFIFDSVQKEGTNLIDTFPKEVDSQQVARVNNSKSGLAVYQCDFCGKAGFAQLSDLDEMGEDGMQMDIPCPEPQCGKMAQAMVKPMDALMMGGDSVPVYDLEDETIPFFNYTIDTDGAKVEGIEGAQWLQIQRLRDLNWMQTHFPGRTFTGPAMWSYPVQASYALSRGRWQYLNVMPQMYSVGHERYEVREIYLHEDFYSSYRAPHDYEFVNDFGERTFRIRKGQSIGQAQEDLYGENCKGLKFIWSQEQLFTICDPKSQELNFRRRFSDCHWSRESGAYNSSPNYSIVYLQDDITLLNTLDHNIAARNAVNPVYFDSTIFEKGDFSNEFIGTKNAAMLDPGSKLGDKVVSLPIPTPSPHLMNRMQWLWAIKDNVSLQTSAMRGESTKGEPFAKARQDLETSYGNLTSVLKSFAQMKCNVGLCKARLAKKYWTKEQFERVASMFGEEWTEEDIDQMCDVDFDRDLIVSYREGTEMPSGPIAKEIKFFGALQQLGQVIAGLPPEVAMQMIGQDKWATIIEKIGEAGDMEFDLSGREIDEIISQKRFNILNDLCEPYRKISSQEIDIARQTIVAYEPADESVTQQAQEALQSGDPEAMKQAQASMAPTPITALDIQVEKILQESGIKFSQYEDLDQQHKFFIEQINNEIGKPQENYMFIEILTVILGMMEQAIQGLKEQEIAKDPQIQAAQAADAAEQADKDKQFQLESGKLQSDIELNQAKLALEKEKLDIEAQNSDRDAFLDLAKHTSTLEDGETVESPAPEEDPIDKISIAFKDLPPSGQQAVLANAGIKVSKAELIKKAKDDKPKPAAKALVKKK